MTVSFVVPVRDGERYLGEALTSLLDQTRPPDEIVVVDDGSSDGSAALAAAMPRVRVLRRPPLGPAAARNAGLAAARGDVVGLLDADDLATPDRIERQLRALHEHPLVGAVFGHVEHFLTPDCAHLAGVLEVPDAAQPGWLISALLARRVAIDAAGPFDETLRGGGETVDWLARLRHVAAAVMLDEVVFRRRVHDAHESRRHGRAGYLDVARAAIMRARGAA